MVAGEYYLPAEIAAELAALPGERDPAYFGYLETVSLEVLVTARRRTENLTLATQVERLLFDNTAEPIRKAAIRHGKPLEGWEDEVEDELQALFWIAIMRRSFFEIRFNRAMKRRAQDAGRSIHGRGQRRLQSEREHRALRGQPGVDYPGGAGEDEYPALDLQILFQEGLKPLPRRQAEALVLLYEHDLPIFSQDPDVTTIATELDCSEPTARRVVAAGLAAFVRWYDEHMGDD